MALPEDVFGSEVWLDDKGLPRRLTLNFEEQPAPLVAFEMKVTIELMNFGTNFKIEIPKKTELPELESFGQLVQEFSLELP